jgi:hypothetical protein
MLRVRAVGTATALCSDQDMQHASCGLHEPCVAQTSSMLTSKEHLLLLSPRLQAENELKAESRLCLAAAAAVEQLLHQQRTATAVQSIRCCFGCECRPLLPQLLVLMCSCSCQAAAAGELPSHQPISASSVVLSLVAFHMCAASFCRDPGIQAVSRAQYTPQASSGNAWNTAASTEQQRHTCKSHLRGGMPVISGKAQQCKLIAAAVQHQGAEHVAAAHAGQLNRRPARIALASRSCAGTYLRSIPQPPRAYVSR